MGKVAKAVNNNGKKQSVLKVKTNKKSLKNKRGKSGAISPNISKTFKNLGDTTSVNISGKKNKKLLVNEKPPKVKKLKGSPKLKQNSVKKDKSREFNNENLDNNNTEYVLKEKRRNSSPKAAESNKNAPKKFENAKPKKSEESKFTPKLKKTTSLKSKTRKFKVKTALIFNQKPKHDNSNIDSTVNLEENIVKSGVRALFELIEKSKSDRALFDDEVPIFLQFSSIKIGKTPSRTLRIPLKHSLLKESGEVCLIISDMKNKNPKKEYEKTIELCEDMLREKGITNIKTVMTYYQLRTDYSEYELKRKLVELYDIFLVDGKLSGFVVKKLGKIFRDKRKLPIPIRLDSANLKGHMKHALLKTSTNLHPNGDNFVIQVGHSEMTEQQVYENIMKVTTHIAKQFPGGWSNIRGLNVKTPKSMSIPIYYTLKNASEVPVPSNKAKRPKAFKVVTGELSTANDREITVLPSGEVKLSKTKKSKQNKRKLGVTTQSEDEPSEGSDEEFDNLSDDLEEEEMGEEEEEEEKEEKEESPVHRKKKKVEKLEPKKAKTTTKDKILKNNIKEKRSKRQILKKK